MANDQIHLYWYRRAVQYRISVRNHYNDVIMNSVASQITSLTIVYSTVYWGADQRKHQSSVSLAFVRGIHRLPVNSQQKWPVICFHLMTSWWHILTPTSWNLACSYLFFSYSTNRSEILHRVPKYHYRGLYKVSKRLDKWNGCYGWLRFREICV